MKDHNFSFGTDFHGNLENIDRFFFESAERGVRQVVFGGDIAPKKMAVSFKDGKGLPFSRADKLSRNDQQILSEELYRKGYMLFPFNVSSDDFPRLLSMDRIEKVSSVKMNEEAIDFWDQYVRGPFVKFCGSELGGKRAFNYFLSSYSTKTGPYKITNAGEFFDRLLQAFRINRFVKDGQFDEKNTDLQKMVGKKKISRTDLAMIFSLVSNLDMAKAETVLNLFFQIGGMFAPFEDIYQELHLHSKDGQLKFAKDFLDKIRAYKSTNRGEVTVMLGNDDQAELIEVFDDADRQGLLHHPNLRVKQVADDLQIFNYPYVPPLPFAHDYWFKEEEQIESDLREIAAKLRTDLRFTIANIHCPPERTGLAQAIVPNHPRRDWGSLAVRNFLENTQVDLALTGHIHESHKVTGQIRERVGKALVINPGASENLPRLYYGNLEDQEDWKLSI